MPRVELSKPEHQSAVRNEVANLVAVLDRNLDRLTRQREPDHEHYQANADRAPYAPEGCRSDGHTRATGTWDCLRQRAHYSPESKHRKRDRCCEPHYVPPPPEVVEDEFYAVKEDNQHRDSDAGIAHLDIDIRQVGHDQRNKDHEEIHRRYTESFFREPEPNCHGHGHCREQNITVKTEVGKSAWHDLNKVDHIYRQCRRMLFRQC